MFAIAAILLNVDAAFACSPKWKSYLSVMKNDLHQLLVAEETISLRWESACLDSRSGGDCRQVRSPASWGYPPALLCRIGRPTFSSETSAGGTP